MTSRSLRCATACPNILPCSYIRPRNGSAECRCACPPRAESLKTGEPSHLILGIKVVWRAPASRRASLLACPSLSLLIFIDLSSPRERARRPQRLALAPARVCAKRCLAAQRIAAASGVVSSLEQLPEFSVDQRMSPAIGRCAASCRCMLRSAPCLRADKTIICQCSATANRLRFARWQPARRYAPTATAFPSPKPVRTICLNPQRSNSCWCRCWVSIAAAIVSAPVRATTIAALHFCANPCAPRVPLLVGIGYSFQEMPELAAQAWDVKMDFVATERELIDCTPTQH